MNIIQTVGPSEEPVTLADARGWCGFAAGVTQDDAILTDLIAEIRGYLEARLKGRKLVSQTYEITLDAAEIKTEIRLPVLPLISITSIVTYDDDGNATTLSSSSYQYRKGEAPRVTLTSSGSWPAMREYDAVTITAVVGYGAQADMPDDLVMLIKGLIQHQYRSKGFGVTETQTGHLITVPRMFERQITALQVEPW